MCKIEGHWRLRDRFCACDSIQRLLNAFLGQPAALCRLQQALIAAPDLIGSGTDQKHVFASLGCTYSGIFDLTVTSNCSHLEIVGDDEVLVAEFFAQKSGDD